MVHCMFHVLQQYVLLQLLTCNRLILKFCVTYCNIVFFITVSSFVQTSVVNPAYPLDAFLLWCGSGCGISKMRVGILIKMTRICRSGFQTLHGSGVSLPVSRVSCMTPSWAFTAPGFSLWWSRSESGFPAWCWSISILIRIHNTSSKNCRLYIYISVLSCFTGLEYFSAVPVLIVFCISL